MFIFRVRYLSLLRVLKFRLRDLGPPLDINAWNGKILCRSAADLGGRAAALLPPCAVAVSSIPTSAPTT